MANVKDILPLPLAPSSMEGHVTLKAVLQQEQVLVCVCVCVFNSDIRRFSHQPSKLAGPLLIFLRTP